MRRWFFGPLLLAACVSMLVMCGKRSDGGAPGAGPSDEERLAIAKRCGALDANAFSMADGKSACTRDPDCRAEGGSDVRVLGLFCVSRYGAPAPPPPKPKRVLSGADCAGLSEVECARETRLCKIELTWGSCPPTPCNSQGCYPCDPVRTATCAAR